MAFTLSSPARALWGKYGARGERYLPLYRHLADTAGIAGRLWDDWLPPAIRDRIIADCGGSGGQARTLAVFLAAVHDVGKATPSFVALAPDTLPRLAALGLDVDPDVQAVHHSVASHLVVHRWLAEQGHLAAAADTLAVIVGGHHGTPTGDQDIARAAALPASTGFDSPAWVAAQSELVDWVAAKTGFDRVRRIVSGLVLTETVQIQLTALVILADWAASDARLFPAGRNVDAAAKGRLDAAWRRLQAQLGAPWVPEDPGANIYYDRHIIPERFTPRTIQGAAANEARKAHGGALMIVEAQPGEGKTEAALAAAEILGEKTGASGIFIGLPTMATASRMFSRVTSGWASRAAEGASAALSHSAYAQDKHYQHLAGTGDESLGVSAWLARSSKTRSLTTFSIGTVDQVLFAALKASHVTLRHLAFASKVVIIDEVHAYDAYMGVYLDRALTWLGHHNAPVIILSATLPPRRRAELVAAYQRGLQPEPTVCAGPAWKRKKLAGRDRLDHVSSAQSYPLITLADKTQARVRPVATGARRIRTNIEMGDDDLEAIARRVREVTDAGGLVGIIRNTVAAAQSTMRHLPHLVPSATFVLDHSRFVRHDRAIIDNTVTEQAGRNQTDRLDMTVESARPRGHVVVGTQVLEQSLDIDFDLLITDLAPVDLLFQRIGRLHRHKGRKRPAVARRPRCIITGVVSWEQDPPVFPHASTYVYPEALLSRTASLILDRLRRRKTVVTPDDIAPWVRAVYSEEEITPSNWQPQMGWQQQRYRAQLADQRARASVYALEAPHRVRPSLIGWLDHDSPDDEPETAGSVRDGIDGIEVALLVEQDDGTLYPLPWIHQVEVDVQSRPSRPVVDAVTATSVRLPASMTPSRSAEPVYEWRKSALIGVRPVIMAGDGTTYHGTIGDINVHYDRTLGLRCGRRQT